MLAADVVQIFVHWWAMDLKNVTRTVLNSFFWSYTLNNLALFSFFQLCIAHNAIRPPDIDFCHLYTLWIRLVTYRKVVKHYSFQRVGMEWKNTLEHQQSMVWFEKVALVEITAIPRLRHDLCNITWYFYYDHFFPRLYSHVNQGIAVYANHYCFVSIKKSVLCLRSL